MENVMTNNLNIENKIAPYVAVVCITFEHGNILMDALDSIYYQSYENIDLILIEDNSNRKKSNTRELYEKFIKEHPNRFRNNMLIQNETRQGLVRSLNTSMEFITADYFTILSGDDLLPKDSIQYNISYIIENNSRMVGGEKILDQESINFTPFESNRVRVSEINDSKTTVQRKMIVLDWFKRGLPFLTTGVVFEVELVTTLGGFDRDYFILEDSPLIYKMIMSGIEFHKHNHPTYIYRIGIGVSSGSNEYLVEYLNDLVKFYRFLIKNSKGLDVSHIKDLLVRTEFNLLLQSKSKFHSLLMVFTLIKHPIVVIRNIEFNKIKRILLIIIGKK